MIVRKASASSALAVKASSAHLLSTSGIATCAIIRIAMTVNRCNSATSATGISVATVIPHQLLVVRYVPRPIVLIASVMPCSARAATGARSA